MVARAPNRMSFEKTLGPAASRRSALPIRICSPNSSTRANHRTRPEILTPAVGKKPAPVSDLAIVLKRDRTTVGLDIKILILFGLVKTREETNPGHGRRKIVELASKCDLVTTM